MADTQKLPIYLQASSPRIIKLYEKFGFHLVHELRLVDGADKCSVYCMVREPAFRKLVPLPPLVPNGFTSNENLVAESITINGKAYGP